MPYSPEEIVTENVDQELLSIKHFKYNEQLPAGINELIYI